MTPNYPTTDEEIVQRASTVLDGYHRWNGGAGPNKDLFDQFEKALGVPAIGCESGRDIYVMSLFSNKTLATKISQKMASRADVEAGKPVFSYAHESSVFL